MSILDIKNLQVSYGGIQAVKGIDLHIEKGELVTLIGANGAGKTSTLRTLVGMEKKSGGSISFDGKDTAGTPVYNFVRQGLVMVPEGRGVFSKLTVAENLRMGGYHRNDEDGIKADIEHVFELFPRLKEREKQLAGTLSGGEQQMVAMGRAIVSKPKLLLLDEPSMGLAPLIVAKIFEIIRMVAEQGVTMLLVEQNARLALEVSQRGYVMESGRITMSGNAQDLLNDDRVRNAYLGE
ncbi:ABC transporter ATP-binding protein [Craterilacuibacter sp. RT1T]|uniref:ATP-binding cassette domain-containing protein n=1 Tax=Craterilacuibacter sinensis TaxID=2686017 RepID=A0A845BLS2_9NEIS|nr:ABC transporter ATP-binding protein [Craterilacuibacter sp. RT1T]MCL6263098.1 ABC transporter ATP-binding protein [Craterilacuibacter sp. RT1T]MCP9758399.1 ABC transporter ATP-binding protein [Aquitalea sp. S1-19]MXR37189.1 ATP-binding cassette domain-containing protein [Craterilacuibacter sinensis]